MKNMVKLLKPKKAPGPDKIRNEMVKTGVLSLIYILERKLNTKEYNKDVCFLRLLLYCRDCRKFDSAFVKKEIYKISSLH